MVSLEKEKKVKVLERIYNMLMIDPQNVSYRHNPTREERWIEYKERNKVTTDMTMETWANQNSYIQYLKLEELFTQESLIVCPHCKSKKVNWVTAQLRRADESETILADCRDCGKNFRIG
tara:strand:- start:795 stop:1154 length:360 start_codon:yes stop_codon:yes gene_type:complete